MAAGTSGITPACRELAQDSRKGKPQSSSRDLARGSAAVNRIKDYTGFAIWFAGLGYLALWPVASPDLDGKPFGAFMFCRDVSLSVLDLLCNSAHPLQLPPTLHALGFLSTMFVTVRLLQYALKRARRALASSAVGMSVPMTRLPNVVPSPQRKPTRPLCPVKPRTHFGLRGMPR